MDKGVHARERWTDEKGGEGGEKEPTRRGAVKKARGRRSLEVKGKGNLFFWR
jgi:hypothetical protein